MKSDSNIQQIFTVNLYKIVVIKIKENNYNCKYKLY